MTRIFEAKRVLLALIVLPLLALGACNTMEGAGQDMQSAGKAVERTADRNR